MNNNNITLIGMPSAGKSTVGVLLAKELGYQFIDTDLLIQRQDGRLLSNIIDEDGLADFLEIEESVCSSLDVSGSVIATGGSVVYKEASMRRLKSLGRVVYIKLSYETINRRIGNIRRRGVVIKKKQTLKELYDEREYLYRKYADITVNADGRTVEDTLELIVNELKKGEV